MAQTSLTVGQLAAVPDSPTGDGISARFFNRGLTSEAIPAKRKLLGKAAARLLSRGISYSSPAKAYWVPGRVEVGGKHTDYAGGRSLLAATTLGFAVVSVDREDSICRISASPDGPGGKPEVVTLDVSPDLEPQQGHWSAYPATAIRRLARNFGIRLGADIALECDLPGASGMSTSSAVICYMWMVLSERNGLRETEIFKSNLKTDEELYTYLGFIENGQDCGPVLVGDKGVGTFGGSGDHTAIMSSEAGRLKLFSYCPTKHEATFDFPSSLSFVIGVSGARAEKTGDAMADYNNAAFLARDAAAAWRNSTGTMPLGRRTFVEECPNLAEVIRHVREELGDAGSDDARVRNMIGESMAKVDDGERYGPGGDARYRKGALRERFEQFFDESELFTPQLAKALAASDPEKLGKITDESHRLTVECLRNTIPETAWLPQEARRLGALGASAFGAGFGGSCWAVVQREGAAAFAEAWAKAYREKFPRWTGKCLFFTMLPGPGACALH